MCLQFCLLSADSTLSMWKCQVKELQEEGRHGISESYSSLYWTEDDVTCLVINKLESLTYY